MGTTRTVRLGLAGCSTAPSAVVGPLAQRHDDIAARQAGVAVGIEASCCGGLPIVSAIQRGLVANRIVDEPQES